MHDENEVCYVATLDFLHNYDALKSHITNCDDYKVLLTHALHEPGRAVQVEIPTSGRVTLSIEC